MTAALVALAVIITFIAAAWIDQPRLRGYQPRATDKPKGPPPPGPAADYNAGGRR